MSAHVEIERKFLVHNGSWRADIGRSEEMEQGYLAQSEGHGAAHPGCSVRVRRAGELAYLTIKSREAGMRRLEFEFPIAAAQASEMLAAFCPERVVKTRHHVLHEGAHWEVDEFAGANAGLVVAEIELASMDQRLTIPRWAGVELTDEPRFYNAALASAPFVTWRDRDYWMELLDAC